MKNTFRDYQLLSLNMHVSIPSLTDEVIHLHKEIPDLVGVVAKYSYRFYANWHNTTITFYVAWCNDALPLGTWIQGSTWLIYTIKPTNVSHVACRIQAIVTVNSFGFFRPAQPTSKSTLICNSLSDQVSIPPMLNSPQLQKKCSSSNFHISFEYAGQPAFYTIPCWF